MQASQYELSFVGPDKALATKPKLVFAFADSKLQETVGRLKALAGKVGDSVDEYCGQSSAFELPERRGRIGYGGCGRVSVSDGIARIEIALAGGSYRFLCTSTIHLLGTVLWVPFSSPAPSNREQEINFSTICNNHSVVGHGHGVDGYVSGHLWSWIRGQAGSGIPEEVVRAMRQAWRATAPGFAKKYSHHCSAVAHEDGRFLLKCFGNACDLGVYPDAIWEGMGEKPVHFSCHNLDSAEQQLTLLAGLAKLCELARKE